jgi:hypothetical protein
MYERYRWRREQRRAERSEQARLRGLLYFATYPKSPAAIALRRRTERYFRGVA